MHLDGKLQPSLPSAPQSFAKASVHAERGVHRGETKNVNCIAIIAETIKDHETNLYYSVKYI